MVYTNWNLKDKELEARRELDEAAGRALKLKDVLIKSAEANYLNKIRVSEDAYNQKVKAIAKDLYLSYFQQGSFKVLYSHILEMIKDEEVDRYFINRAFDELRELIYYDINENPNYPSAIKEYARGFMYKIKMKPNGEVYFKDEQGEEE